MSLFIRVDCDFPEHPKTLRFIRLCADPLAPFSIVRLWLWTAEKRPSGSLAGMDGEDIERAAGWTGMPGKFYFAAKECGFVDGDSGEHKIHGWREHQDYFIREKKRKAELAKRLRLDKSSALRSAHCARHIPESSAPRGEERRGEESSTRDLKNRSLASPPEPPSRKVKPLSEQTGFIGDLARVHLRLFRMEPTWPKEELIALRKKRSSNGHLTDGPYLFAYERVFCEDAYWKERGFPLWAYVRHLDTFMKKLVLDPEDFHESQARQ